MVEDKKKKTSKIRDYVNKQKKIEAQAQPSKEQIAQDAYDNSIYGKVRKLFTVLYSVIFVSVLIISFYASDTKILFDITVNDLGYVVILASVLIIILFKIFPKLNELFRFEDNIDGAMYLLIIIGIVILWSAEIVGYFFIGISLFGIIASLIGMRNSKRNVGALSFVVIMMMLLGAVGFIMAGVGIAF